MKENVSGCFFSEYSVVSLKLTLKAQVSTQRTLLVSVQRINICYCCCYNRCSKCPPSAYTQARRWVRYWFTSVVILLAPLLCQLLHQVDDITNSWANWSGGHTPVAGPRSHSRLDRRKTFINIRSSLLITILFLFIQKLRKWWRQYWQGVSTISNTHALIGNVGNGNFRPSYYKKQYLSNRQASCCQISHKHCK